MTIKELIVQLNKIYIGIENNLDEIKIILKDSEKLKDKLDKIITTLEDDGINE